ncbi:MAG: ABC transporter ATP-binding protein [Syntrophomonadaceae bacterium]|nr:ABC transporter ATP-binding protein [Syntrophomonadaceae bacterium]
MGYLQIKGVSKTLGRIHTLDNISLSVNQYESVVILGPSGCGKSTLLNIVAGLISPDQGQILIDGEDWTGRTGRVSYMQQKDLLLPSRTILDNVAIPLILKGTPKKQARQIAQQHLTEFGLSDFSSYYPRQLSGGMRQRAALLSTYLFARDILLLDEPFAALDAITRRRMHLWLKDLQSRYRWSILFVTHDIEEALIMADRILVLSARPARILQEFAVPEQPDITTHQSIKKNILQLLEPEEDDTSVYRGNSSQL